MAVGGLLAYIVRPLVARLERLRVPRGLAIGLLLLAFGLATLFIVTGIRAVMPNDTGMIELRIRALYAFNQRYQALMGLDRSLTRGNRIYQWLRGDLDPVVDRVNQLLALTPEERGQFVAVAAAWRQRRVGRVRPAGRLRSRKSADAQNARADSTS